MQRKVKNYILSLESMGDVVESFLALQKATSPIIFITNNLYVCLLEKINKNEHINFVGVNSSNKFRLIMDLILKIRKPNKIIICHRNKILSRVLRLLFPLSSIFKLKYPHENVQGLIYKSTRNRYIQYSMLYRASGISLSEKVYELIDCKLDNKKAIFAVGGGNNVAPLGARGGKHILSLCKYIKENFDEIETLYLIGKGDDDLRISKYVQEYFINIEVVNLVDKIELADLHEYLLSSSQFFSFDSGLMHLSCFYNTNKYFVFGPTNPSIVLPMCFEYNILGQFGDCINCYNPDDGVHSPTYKCIDSTCTKIMVNDDESS